MHYQGDEARDVTWLQTQWTQSVRVQLYPKTTNAADTPTAVTDPAISTGEPLDEQLIPGLGILSDMFPPTISSVLPGRSALSRNHATLSARTGTRLREIIGCALVLPLLLGEPAPAAAYFETKPELTTGHSMRYPVPHPAHVLRAFDAPEHGWSAGHRGVDLLLQTQAPVLAPTAGSISFVGHVVDRGVLVIEHENGTRSSFEPVESDLVVGQWVETGAVVAHLDDPDGTRSHCGTPCLHWGVRAGDIYLDPLRLVLGEPSVLFPEQIRR